MANAFEQEDVALQWQVEAALSSLVGLPIVVTASGGTVYLRGAVTHPQQVPLAERLARQVPGVTRLVNELAVDEKSVPLIHVREVELRDEFESGATAGEGDPLKSVEDGVPYFAPVDPVVIPANDPEHLEVLGGFAGSALEAPFEPEPHGPHLFDDDHLRQDVQLALREEAGTSDLPIRVHVHHGVVHLRGQVQSIEDAELAEEVAWRVPGIVHVREDLDIA